MFHVQRIPQSIARCCRLLSSSQGVLPFVGVTVDDEGIATIQLQRAPVNSLNLEALQKLQDSLCKVEDSKCKGLILTSASPKIFSAGADLMEFHKPDVKRLAEFKECLFDVVAKLFGTNIITTVAINGYTGAAACVLALTCEYRTMTTGKATIGLNDTAVGIAPGKWIEDLMIRTMGPRQAELALTSSTMLSAERALQVGLIDEVATDKMDAIQKCKTFIKTFDHISPVIRAATKRSLRQKYLTSFENNRKQSVTDFLDMATSPAFQDAVDKLLQSLKEKKAVKV